MTLKEILCYTKFYNYFCYTTENSCLLSNKISRVNKALYFSVSLFFSNQRINRIQIKKIMLNPALHKYSNFQNFKVSTVCSNQITIQTITLNAAKCCIAEFFRAIAMFSTFVSIKSAWTSGRTVDSHIAWRANWSKEE